MKALITGSESFVGQYLIEELVSKGYEVIATYSCMPPKINPKVKLIQLDILDLKTLINVLDRQMPNIVFHLASSHQDEEDDDVIMDLNVEGTKNIIEAVEEMDKSPSLLIIGSAEEYGIPKLLPIPEDHPLTPISVFGKSKVLAENLAKDSVKRGFRVVILRAFDIIGPGQNENYFISSLLKKIINHDKSKNKSVELANSEMKRDFIDVRDFARACVIAAEKGETGGIYNVCSGNAYELKKIAEKAMELSKAKIDIKDLKEKMIIPILVGDNRNFFKKTGWRPLIDIDSSISDTLDYWRNNK